MNEYARLMFQALTTPLGIIVQHEDPQGALVQFGQAQKQYPELKALKPTIVEGHPDWVLLVKWHNEKPNLLTELMSGSSDQTSNGSRTDTVTRLELRKPSE